MSNLKTFLCDLQVFVDKINSTTSRKEKQEILKSDGEPFKEILAHVHNDFITHGITSKLVKRQLDSEGNVWVEITPTDTVDDLWVLLNGFANRSYTGGRAVGMWCNLIITHKEHTELLLNILDKDFKFRMGAKDINAVFPNLIPEFNVALAEKFGDGKNSELIENGEWLVSKKCDGCVHKDSIIVTKKNGKMTIGEFVDNNIQDKVLSFNHKKNRNCFAEVTGHLKNGVDVSGVDTYQWYEITLENGVVTKLTGNHRIWCENLNCYRRVDELDGTETVRLK